MELYTIIYIFLSFSINLIHCKVDWLIQEIKVPVTFQQTSANTWKLCNSLISRTFTTSPDFATIDFYSYDKQQSILRGINAEASIVLNNHFYNIGGLNVSIPRAYLNRTALQENMNIDQDAFHFVAFKTGKPMAPFPYRPKRGAPKDIVWPPDGLRLDVKFAAPPSAPSLHQSVVVYIHYEMYVGIPLLVKWITIQATQPEAEDLTFLVNNIESLSVNQQWASHSTNANTNMDMNWLFVETTEPHGTDVRWGLDYGQEDMPGSFEPIVNVTYSPPVPLLPISSAGYESFKIHELVIGSSNAQRSALSKIRMLRLLAPHTQENPIFFHMVYSDSKRFRYAVDQLSEVGFEMIIYSFGSAFDIESTNDTYINQVAADIAYANKKGIEVGGYDLIAWTRGVDKDWELIDNHGQTESSACFASQWYNVLLESFLNFIQKTNLSMVETDGPYPGYECYSTNHSHHHNALDSVYWQSKLQGQFFKILREREIYINQPDNYFYYGGSRTGLGYDENQYSLPRWQDLSVSRQGMYDDTYTLPPTAGWMFAPLVEYHGGGPEAEFEPLSENSVAFEWALAQYLGGGTAACYRGYRIYDSDHTKAIAQKWVSFYKKYRDIITSDIIHVRRPDMQSIDCFMHVNPFIKNRALAMVFNPTLAPQKMNLSLPLYYTGLKNTAQVFHEGKDPQIYVLDDYYIDVPVSLMPLNITWFLIQ